MPLPGIITSRYAALSLVLAVSAFAQTFYWNPSAPLLNSGGELHKSYNWTASANGSGAWPKSAGDDDFTSTTLGAGWKFIDSTKGAVGGNPGTWSLTANPGQLNLTGRGFDVWWEHNEFAAMYKDFADTFDISIKVNGLTEAADWSKAGIMVMNKMATPSAGGCFALIVTPKHGIKVQFDSLTTVGDFETPEGDGVNNPVVYPVWLRVAKKHGTFYGYYRTSLSNPWTLVRAGTPQLTDVVSQAGPFLTSHNTGVASTALFDDFQSGGDIQAANLDLSFNGSTVTADSNSRMTASLSAKSLSLSGFGGTFGFNAATLALSGNADFSTTAVVDASKGTLAFGAGSQTLTPRAGWALPLISKTGGGTLTIATRPANAGLLTVNGSTVDFGNHANEFAGLAASTAMLTGLTANDTAVFTGDANFTGVTALPTLGAIQIKSIGNPVSQRDVIFTPGTAAFNNLSLRCLPSSMPARIAVGGASLTVKGNLALVDEKGAAGLIGIADFRPGNANVTVDGNLQRVDGGTAGVSNSLQMQMGNGTWTVKGDVALSFPAGFSADNSTLDLASAATQSLSAAGSLGTVRHIGIGTVSLGTLLQAAIFSQSAGSINLNGNNVNVAGAFGISNGSANSLLGLPGREIRAGGDINFAGTSGGQLGLNPGSLWYVSAGGALTADYADIGNSQATGSQGAATAACNDKNGNTRWTFTLAPPTIVRQPVAKITVLSTQKAVFTVKASGSAPLAYAWRKQGDTTVLSTDTLISITAAPSLDGAKYYCTVGNGAGNVPSLDGELQVNEPAYIPAPGEPSDAAVTVGDPVQFTVVGGGTAPLKYRWRKTGDTTTVDTNAVLKLAATAANQDGASWSCTVSNAFGSAISRKALLTLRFPAKITVQPKNADVAATQSARFSAAASGSGAIAFAWFRQGAPDTLGKDSVLILKAAAGDNGAKFFCAVANAYGQDNSLPATLTVGQLPDTAAGPRDTTVLAGQPVTFKVRAIGTAPFAFAWRKVGRADTLGKDSTYVYPPVVPADSGSRFYCIVSNKYGSMTTREAVLGVVQPPSIIRQPKDSVVAVAGQSARFSLGTAGTPPLRYQWTRKNDTTVLSRDTVLTLEAVALAATGTLYTCLVVNDYGSIQSKDSKLVVVQAATILREPGNVSVGPGKKAVFSVGAAGAKPMAFKWQRKGDTAAVSRDSVYTIDSVKLKDDGAIFTVIVSNAYGADTSREAKVTVVVCDSLFKVAPDTVTVDEGQPATIKGTAACSQSYEWSVVSGPAPRIFDPEVATLDFTAPRVLADTVIVYRFSAQYATGPSSKTVVVRVREVIPDPQFTLPSPAKWTGAKPYVLRPTVTNSAALKASPYAPPFRYQWFLSPALADSARAGDSLTLSDPDQDGTMQVTLCLDNGGAARCQIHELAVNRTALRLAARLARLGPVTLEDRSLSWNADGAARVWGFDGRLLWQGRGRAGMATRIPDVAARALYRGGAHLEIVK